MAFKEYGSNQEVTEWVTLGGFNKKTGKANPTKISGHYLGSITGPNPFRPGEEKVTLVVQTKEGKKVGVNTSSNLVKTMKNAEVEFTEEFGYSPRGAAIIVEFLREVPTGKGNPAKIFSVKLDGADMSTPSDEDYSNETEYSEDDGSDDVAQAEALAQLERKAKVEAMLKGRAGSAKKN